MFTDVQFDRDMDGPGPKELLSVHGHGDALAFVRLGRLGWSLRELLTMVAMMKARGISLLGEEEQHIVGRRGLIFHVSHRRAHQLRHRRRARQGEAAGLSPVAVAFPLVCGGAAVDRRGSRAGTADIRTNGR